MKIVISQQGVKRELIGPYDICLSRQDLETLLDRLNETYQENFAYGWIGIYERPRVEVVPNTTPLPWKENL